MKTGFYDLDNLINLEGNNLIILAGRKAIGKSTLALNIVTDIALKQEIPTLYMNLQGMTEREVTIQTDFPDDPYIQFIKSYRNSKEEIIDKIVASQTLIKVHKIQVTNMRNKGIKVIGDILTDEEQTKVNECINKIENSKLHIEDKTAMSIKEISNKCRELKDKNNIKFIVIDNMELIKCDEENFTREQELTYINNTLKVLSEELNTPILLILDLSNEIDKRQDPRPVLQDIKVESIIKNADIIMSLYRHDYYHTLPEKYIAEVKIFKNKFGRLGKAELFYLKEYCKIGNLDKRYN